jgi:putative membrane protein
MSESMLKSGKPGTNVDLPSAIIAGEYPDLVSVELSSRQTGMSFQRTRMSADRTLMSVIRTSLSLIGFGFTIYQFFQSLREKNLLNAGSHAARNFGATLVYLGVGMVAIGIIYHLQFMRGLRRERIAMTTGGLVHSQSVFPVSFTLIVAILLLFVGIAAIASLTFNVGPFE